MQISITPLLDQRSLAELGGLQFFCNALAHYLQHFLKLLPPEMHFPKRLMHAAKGCNTQPLIHVSKGMNESFRIKI